MNQASNSPADTLCQFIPPFMRFLREGLIDMNMSPARFQILETLNSGGALTMVALADRLSVSKRNVTTLVDGLEKEGLAQRLPHPKDRRSTLVALTDHGEDIFAEAAAIQAKRLRALLAHLDTDQQTEMNAALLRLTALLANRE